MYNVFPKMQKPNIPKVAPSTKSSVTNTAHVLKEWFFIVYYSHDMLGELMAPLKPQLYVDIIFKGAGGIKCLGVGAFTFLNW